MRTPKGYRGLAILSVCFRIWGVATLRRSSSWVQSWQTDDLFAGTTAWGPKMHGTLLICNSKMLSYKASTSVGAAQTFTNASTRFNSGCWSAYLSWLVSPQAPCVPMLTLMVLASSSMLSLVAWGSPTPTHAAYRRDAP